MFVEYTVQWFVYMLLKKHINLHSSNMPLLGSTSGHLSIPNWLTNRTRCMNSWTTLRSEQVTHWVTLKTPVLNESNSDRYSYNDAMTCSINSIVVMDPRHWNVTFLFHETSADQKLSPINSVRWPSLLVNAEKTKFIACGTSSYKLHSRKLSVCSSWNQSKIHS